MPFFFLSVLEVLEVCHDYSFTFFFFWFFQFYLNTVGGQTESAEGIIQGILCTVMSHKFLIVNNNI